MDKRAQTTQTIAQRDSNLELYRVIVMILIVAHHYVVNSGMIDLMNRDPLSVNSIFLRVFGAWGKTGINCFVLITGYFMCKSQITLKKYAKLLLEVQLYNLAFYCIFAEIGYEQFSITGLLKLLIPVTNVSTGFTGCFLLFYLFIPFLNILIRSMNQRQHLLLVLLCLTIYTGIGSVPGFGVTLNYVTWFVILYLVASFIRCYPRKVFENNTLWGWVAVGCVTVSAASILLLVLLGKESISYFFVADSYKVLAVATALSSFLLFKNLKIRYSKGINTLGATTFGVLLIHANSDAMRQWLWKDLLQNTEVFDSAWLPIHAIGSVIAIFAVCVCIDMLRIRFIEKPFFKMWDSHYPRVRAWFELKTAGVCKKLHIKE